MVYYNSRLRKETNGVGHSKIWAIEDFNSRLRKETNGDMYRRSSGCIPFQLTSPQGDEQKNPREFAPEKIFQITSPFGDEPYLHLHLLPQRQLKFQLTSPQGDEHFSSFNLLRIVYFNSRLREGTNTFFQVFFKRTFSITTHIPTRRRTDGIVASIAAPSFQITSPFGDELQILVLGTYSSYFNSHPRKETNIKFHCHLR